MYDFIVVGAGLYGATIAKCLTNLDYDVLVVEKESTVGGMCGDKKFDDFYLHLNGPHIFHTDHEAIWQFVNKYSRFNNFINSPKARYDGRLYSLPFNMNTFYELFGAKTAEQAKKAIEKDRVKFAQPKNLEEHVLNIAGKTIYKTLVKDYTEKQWGKPCKELSASIIKRLPFRYTFDNNYFDSAYQGIPTIGYTNMIRNILASIDVVCNFDFVDRQNYDWCKRNCRRKIIYTGSVDRLFDYDLGRLEYRSLRFDHVTLSSEDVQSNAVINWTGHEVKFTRSIEHKHFMKSSSKSTVITYEYPAIYNGLNKPYYPMLDQKNIELYEAYVNRLPAKIVLGGRLGKYKYFDMDKVVLEAMQDAVRYSL